MRDLSKQYGPLMLLHLGPSPTIVISSPDAAREIMKNHDISFASRPITTAIDTFTFGGKGILFSPYGKYWRQVRKICIQDKKLATTVNDITTRAIIGTKCKNQDVFLQELETAQNIVAGFNLTDLFPSSRLARSVSRAKKLAEKTQQAISCFLDEVIEQHKESQIAGTGESNVEILLTILLRSHDNEILANPLDMETIKAIILDLFGAGSETSTTTLEWAMSELLRNPTVMEKAQSEVRRLLEGSTTVSESDLDKLQYLHLVIKETLRLHPAGPLLLPRECREACRVFGYDIPKGTRVLVNAWAIGRDPKYWEDPEEFKPERFMNGNIDFKGADFEFIPFGSGRRICPGMSFGLASMELILASLLYHFDWELGNGLKPEEIDMSELFSITARRKTPLLLYAVPHKTNIP
ncbi:hypothetical protein LUZ63_008445 [Rhynchospora breviuscula]|uniref:Cytochrome P450 n=1 Tax=Rhynchospora breviuscula TaxID=2022672 RepID=A0A9Q0CTW8_9POAL|nr:hypothetical protein LUZ63_008445 [Rhynchospora breviuscula]